MAELVVGLLHGQPHGEDPQVAGAREEVKPINTVRIQTSEELVEMPWQTAKQLRGRLLTADLYPLELVGPPDAAESANGTLRHSPAWSCFAQVAAAKYGEPRQRDTDDDRPTELNGERWREASRVNRTQEVAGSSPASST
jgi:hypothetical protein